MKNKIILLMIICMIGLVGANLGSYKQGACIDLKGNINATAVNVTVYLPDSSINVTEGKMSRLKGDIWNYTFCDTDQEGVYIYDYCDEINENCIENVFDVSKTGRDDTSIWITLVITIVLMGFIYGTVYKRNKMVGGIAYLISGVLIMYIEPIISFAGIIIVLSSIAIIVYDMMPRKTSVSSGKWIRTR